MTLKIYGIAASRAFRNLWAAEELGLPYEHIKLRFDGPEIKSPEFLKINPNGAIPAIDDDGILMFESLAINLHLARRYGAGTLGAASVAEDAHILQWTFWAATEIESLSRLWFTHTVYLPEAERKADQAAWALEGIRNKFPVVEGHLASRQWLAADRFTVADLNLAAVLMRLKEFGGEAFPHLWAWHARCLARPAAQRAMALRAAA